MSNQLNNKYQTFAPRFFAGLIDQLIFFPFLFQDLFLDMTKVQNILMVNSASLLLFGLYVVIGHGVYGQTVGKKLMKVKLLDISEQSTIGLFRAFLRESVWVVLSLIGIIQLYLSTNGKGTISIELQEQLFKYTSITVGWFFLEIITMLTNSKSRAIHDFIARSVVVKIQANSG